LDELKICNFFSEREVGRYIFSYLIIPYQKEQVVRANTRMEGGIKVSMCAIISFPNVEVKVSNCLGLILSFLWLSSKSLSGDRGLFDMERKREYTREQGVEWW
jgi:hypothetical protein